MSEQGPIQDVNIELGDEVSTMLYEASKLTYDNRPGLIVSPFDSFSGFKAIDGDYLGDLRGHLVNMGLDGVGTKVEIAERTGIHSTVAHDLFAMICDDAAVRGAEPLAVGSILDVRNLNDDEPTRNAVQQLAEGYVKAAALAGVVVVNGEVAELGDRVDGYVSDLFKGKDGRFNYNWGGVVFWDALKTRALDGSQIKPGDSLVGFAEHGFRSNGITDVRKAMLQTYGPHWHEDHTTALSEQTLGELVLQPSTIYCRVINELTGGRRPEKEPRAEVHGVAHITGGGMPSKLDRMLEASGYGAIINEPIEPPAIMTHVQELRAFPDKKAYSKWHMGPGMIIATPNPDSVIETAEEAGIIAQPVGHVTEKAGIKIKNRGAIQQEEWLEFSHT